MGNASDYPGRMQRHNTSYGPRIDLKMADGYVYWGLSERWDGWHPAGMKEGASSLRMLSSWMAWDRQSVVSSIESGDFA